MKKAIIWVGLTTTLVLIAANLLRAKPPVDAGTGASLNPTPPTVIEPMKPFHKPTTDDLKKKLTPLQYKVTQEAATEPPFHNAFYDNHEPGIYVDIVSGEPLFSSLDKFDSGCGWPSFSKPLAAREVVEKPDTTLGRERTEVRSLTANSHLGHVFDDGPGPTGLRYCINSASLRFIPLDKLDSEGYGPQLEPFIRAGLFKPKSSNSSTNPPVKN